MQIRKIDDGTLDHVYSVNGPNGPATIRYSTDYLDDIDACANVIFDMIVEDYFDQTEG
jgi:hypothetical protein